MLDIGWTELLIIGVVALVVVGPKDLPKMFRTLGQLTGKARAMARDFQRAMDAAADETGVKDMARDFRDTASGRKFKDEMGLDELDRDMRAMGRPDQWGSDKNKPGTAKPETVAQRKAPEAAADGAEAEDDAAIAAEHDADLAARNKKTSALEVERLKAADRAAAARTKAAEIRARREAEAAEKAATPAASEAKAKTTAKATAKTATKARAKPAEKSAAKTAAKPARPAASKTAKAAESGAADAPGSGAGARRKTARPAKRQSPEAET